MKKISALIFAGILFFGCAPSNDDVEKGVDHETLQLPETEELEAPSVPLDYELLAGTWRLRYPGGFGYDFRFGKSYQSVIVVYTSSFALVFRGVTKITAADMVRINVYGMKRVDSGRGIYSESGLTRVKSSYFDFRIVTGDRNGKEVITVVPVKLIIDGNDSQGYFEPRFTLQKVD